MNKHTPAFMIHKEALRKNIAESVAKSYMQLGAKASGIDWFATAHEKSSSSARKAA